MTKPEINKKHVTIIGAGIIGMSSAIFLQRAGFAVTIIDKVPPGEGASFGNAGGVVVSSIMPTVHPRMLLKIPGWLLDPKGPITVRLRHLPKALPWLMALGRNAMPDRVRKISAARAQLGLRALEDHKSVLAHAGASNLLALDDGLNIYGTEKDYRDNAHWRAIREEYGYKGEELSGNEAREIEPDLTQEIYKAEFWDGWHRITNPHTMVVRLAEQVMRDGGRILFDEVVRIDHDGKRATTVHLKTAGQQTIENLCICAGAWSHELAAMLGSRVLLEAERGYHILMQNPGIKLSRAITHAAQPGAVTPHEGGIKLAGSDEIAGNDAAPDWRRAYQLHVYGKRLFPGLRDLDGTESKWMGRRPGTPDSLPVISPSPKLANVWYGFGHGHLGLSWGPTTGRLLAEMIATQPQNSDLSAFKIDRSM
ncbi:MAG: FAD-binding oxidoreductase [Anderseniella sp.]